ncbi:MAG: ATP-binding cassette family protein [Cyanobacteria bacterium SW_11_48_12]|nr:MAG: ATP-binding cassette family protein [Cyanobacteria bacterium SW_11_48_12]
MVPLQLTLKNFLSYREASLDFHGLHTACICGPNGAGKSSLLEAITWAIWGQTRTATEDDVIHAGAKEVRVDFLFMSEQETYRVIRSRRRGQSSSLEFQVKSEGGNFRSLTGRGVRATQQQIISLLKLDYDTFINSAYLRQGRADEFMMRRPSERKQILADLLKLDQYEELAEQAKDTSKQFKGQAEQLEQSLQPLEEQLQQREAIAQQQKSLETQLQQVRQAQEQDQQRLQHLQAIEQQRQTQKQQLNLQQTQYQNLSQDCDRLQQERSSLHTELTNLQQTLKQESEINAGYNEYLRLQREEENLSAQFQAYQDAQQQRQQLHEQQTEQINQHNLQIRQTQAELDSLEQQEQETTEILRQADEVAKGLEQLQHHRQRLQQLDKLQHHVAPLLQRRQTLQTEIDRVQARLSARWEQLRSVTEELSQQVSQLPQVRSRVQEVEAEIEQLEKKHVYRQRVEEKGKERSNFQQRLQENQRNCEKQLAELGQKLEMLETPDATCPLCDRALDEHYKQHVVNKTQTHHSEVQEQFWVLREQMATCERELQILRGEYRQLTDELTPYESLIQQKGQLQAKLENTGEVNEQLQATTTEKEQIERSLSGGNYAQQLQNELQQIEQELQRLNYDEQTHALARGEVERWRWAEIKSAKLEDAKRRKAQLHAQKPKLQERITELQTAMEQLRHNSDIQRQIAALDRQIAQLGYERKQHNAIIADLRQAQSWQLRYQQLQQAQQQYPQLETRLQELDSTLQARIADKEAAKAQLDTLIAQTEQTTDNRDEIQTLEQQIQQHRQQLDELFAQQGRIEQVSSQLETVQAQYEQSQQRLQTAQRQHRVYQELAQAFGKNGIQALMIENVLPQLEAQTNQILSRITGNQLHVQFLTQKAGRGRSKKKSSKLIDTLEILIADSQGTRAYETYSGGEGFRINFAIRLALAQLLAQRAGTSLQMLIVDEGFGTQDEQGCERLIAAINAIAPDFSCILTVTHMPQFKEAFTNRIEVRKTPNGSQLSLST